jgi:excisionase family DNA binding protein
MNHGRELTAAESCRRLGVTLDYLYRLIYAGKLTARKVEGVWKVSESAVEERLAKRPVKLAA